MSLPSPFAQVFARTAYERGSAVAVVDTDGSLDYAGIATWADRLAARLQAASVHPEEPVGVCVGRGARLAAAFLGVLRAGGAYVPLDQSYPARRLALMARDAGVRAVVADEIGSAACRELQVEIVPSSGEPSPSDPRGGPTETDVRPEQLAYVVYTSGSTGRPKGVAVSHGALSSHVERAAAAYGIESDDLVLMALSPSFDASIEVLALTLAAGATLVFPEGDVRNVEAIVETIITRRVTVAALPPPAWDAVVDLAVSSPRDVLNSLRLLVVGGQESRVDQVQRWRAAAPGARILNVYGPSEAVITATTYALEPRAPMPTGATTFPIGYALPAAQLLLLDDDLEPVPPSGLGEIVIGGATLARGYVGDPRATALRFLPNPYAGTPGERMYRTGDLGRLRSNDGLEFVGRRDTQAKVRGFRIELGEVEAALVSHPEVVASAAVSREFDGDRRLIGFVVLRPGASASMRKLQEFTETVLPPHAVPSVVVQLDELPKTPSGKIDRHALSEPELAGATCSIPPRTQYEETVARVWSEVLAIESISIRDDFFQLGGHSLLATQAIGRLRQEFQRDIPVRALFDAPTIEEFVELVGLTADAPDHNGRGDCA